MKRKMNNIKRALIYIGRQKVRSLILFGIFLVTLLLALLGFTVLNASARVGEELRRSVPGYVSVLRDTKNKGSFITEKTVNEIRVRNGVAEVNANSSQRLVFPDLVLLAEMLVIALIAVLIAWPISAAVSGGIGQSLFRTVAQQSGRTAADFNVQVSAAAVFSTIGVAVGIMMLATMISALQVLALQPKKILSMMS